MTATIKEKMYQLIMENDKHLNMLEWALKQVHERGTFPLNEEKLQQMNNEDIALIDVITFRFSKLQDTSAKLLRLIFSYLEENTDEATFIDILNKAEKKGIIPSSYKWREIRSLRNMITHDYVSNYSLLASELNEFVGACRELMNTYQSIKNFILKNIPFVNKL